MADKPTRSDPLTEEKLAEILSRVGPRPAPTREIADEIKANVRAAWQEEVERQTARGFSPFAIAASIMVAIVAGWFFLAPPPTQENVAQIEHVINDVQYFTLDDRWVPLVKDHSIAPSSIRTGSDGLVSLKTANGFDVRLATNTEVKLIAPDELEVITGSIYVDSHELAGAQINVITPFGNVRDLGTQFEVRVEPAQWRVQVRDGVVEMRDGTSKALAQAGDRIWISAADFITRERIAANDPSWDWSQQAVPAFGIDGTSLSEYLTWVSREVGETVAYNNKTTENDAKRTILHGSIEGLTPRESLSVVLATTNFRLADSEPGIIAIEK